MSGIVGMLRRDGKSVSESEIKEMLSAIQFRGPDGHAVWAGGTAGLGNCILHTTTESMHEKLPYTNIRGDLVITADARIDNRDELISQLHIQKNDLSFPSDSALILSAYETWGEDCVKKLRGDFAFVIWDHRLAQLFCAVDHFRRRPISYFVSTDLFVFSSLISGLLPGKLVPGNINDISLGALFFEQLSELDKTTTCFRDIYQLPPASYLRINSHSMTVSEYWSPAESVYINRNSDAEYEEEFSCLLRDAIRSRLRTNCDTGIALSGGIDSVSIAALSREFFADNGRNLLSISALSGNEADSIESGYIRKAVSSSGITALLMKPDMLNATACANMVSLMKKFDSPMAYQNIFLLFLFHVARTHNIRVMLTGADGDTLLGLGRHYISHLVKNLEIRTAIREAILRGRNTENNPFAWAGILPQAFRNAFFPNFVRPWTGKIRNRLNYKSLLKRSMINPDFARSINLLENLSNARKRAGFGLTDSIYTMRIRTFSQPFISWMSISMDMMGSVFSLDLRHPYQDKRLIEYCIGIPWNQKNRDGWEKFILRKVMKGRIPETIRWRKVRDETGWEYVKKFATLIYPEIEPALHDKNHRIYEYFDYTTTRKVVKKDRDNDANWDYVTIIKIYGLYHWLNSRI